MSRSLVNLPPRPAAPLTQPHRCGRRLNRLHNALTMMQCGGVGLIGGVLLCKRQTPDTKLRGRLISHEWLSPFSLMVPWCCLGSIGKATACLAAAAMAGWLFSAPAGPDPITFEDVASKAGVEFILQNAATGDKHQIETMVSGVAVFDYNNDGWPDLYFVNGASQPSLAKTNPGYYNPPSRT